MAEKKEPASQPAPVIKKVETPRPDPKAAQKLEQAASDALRAPHNPQRAN